jgi:hypothetical protein
MTRKEFEAYIRHEWGIPCGRYKRTGWRTVRTGDYRIRQVQMAWEVLQEAQRREQEQRDTRLDAALARLDALQRRHEQP